MEGFAPRLWSWTKRQNEGTWAKLWAARPSGRHGALSSWPVPSHRPQQDELGQTGDGDWCRPWPSRSQATWSPARKATHRMAWDGMVTGWDGNRMGQGQGSAQLSIAQVQARTRLQHLVCVSKFSLLNKTTFWLIQWRWAT